MRPRHTRTLQELFIAALAELTYHEARSEKRKTVQYDDFGTFQTMPDPCFRSVPTRALS